MPVEEQLATIFEVLEGGVETTAEVIPFPVDTGATALEGTTTTVQLGNGIATEVSQLTVTEAGTTTTAGVGLLAMDVGAVGLIIAPFLGLAVGGVAGNALYNLSPEFWLNVSNQLVEAGQTIGGKVRGFINGIDKTFGLSEATIEIYKNAFLEAGLFNETVEVIDCGSLPSTTPQSYKNYDLNGLSKEAITSLSMNYIDGTYSRYNNANRQCYDTATTVSNAINTLKATFPNATKFALFFNTNHAFMINIYALTNISKLQITARTIGYSLTLLDILGRIECRPKLTGTPQSESISTVYQTTSHIMPMFANIELDPSSDLLSIFINEHGTNPVYTRGWFFDGLVESNLQPDAIPPTADPFPETYPNVLPWSIPVEGFPEVYPIEIPEVNPNPSQQEAQNPKPLPDDNPDLLPWFINNFPQPEPNPDPYPQPSIEPDPDPQPEPNPIENPTEPDTDPNPVDPNPDPSLPALPIVPDIPDTVPANAMFTVYKPTMAQVNSFGGWLWSNNIMEAIKRIWQNPLDGIISFMKVYVDAPTSGSDTIKVGMLDSEVSSAVVTGQFVTVECGSINIREKFYNATDYSPFVSLHVYLPFIGIVELDIDEFMSGEIKITYHVDVYTGTCLAEIKARRSYDKPEWTIIYTFSGNASQQLPLTSASFSGALSSLVSIVGGGLAIASGGGLGLLAGATGLAHAVTHEMVHLAHSGSLSANAGIMGARKPFLILTRRRSYDANGYNELYGYPSNKTVFLNNCSGFVKVKDIQLKTSATDVENKEIETLLKNGVII